MEELINSPQISFTTEAIEFQLSKEEELKQWLTQVAAAEQRTVAILEYIFCSDDYLLEINKQYLDHDYYTDIITFPLQDSPLEATIFISVDRVRENAELYQVGLVDELHRVMVHGLLHLIGYKDNDGKDKTEMRAKEDDCLAQRSFV